MKNTATLQQLKNALWRVRNVFLAAVDAIDELSGRVRRLEDAQISELEATVEGEVLIIRKVLADTAAEAEE